MKYTKKISKLQRENDKCKEIFMEKINFLDEFEKEQFDREAILKEAYVYKKLL